MHRDDSKSADTEVRAEASAKAGSKAGTKDETKDETKGPTDAEREFVDYAERSQRGLYRLAFLLSGRRESAQDLTQTTLAQMYRYWRRATQVADLDAYARTILLRAFFAEQRRFRRERDLHLLMDAPRAPDHPEVRLALLDALAQLPPRSRAVVALRHWVDLSVEDTAAHLGCSTGTVKSLNSRALVRLRELLPEHVWEEYRHGA
ncbi:sigma-70 family RNA polymerase sigma factor [Embleya sp. NBC_00896]|uniref:sigma-70 family RNA polymerase sigma factor n=1 Tax=Embleya sp. NBC_00896 TaxID=2975961 RepID=UPI00386B3ABA|nr:sigma-70 family RNA polymerase sigma factor [Embleya sp. NBC_00896]